jgi:hypothetical protein
VTSGGIRAVYIAGIALLTEVMNMRCINTKVLVVISILSGSSLLAQTPAVDPSARLKEVLPPGVAARVLAVISRARSSDLPAEALENRALKFAARGVDPRGIERAISEQEARMEQVRDTLQRAGGRKPSGDEIDAGAEAVRKGVDGGKIASLARSTPAGRSLAVPLYVIGSLVDRGLPSDSALQRVTDRLKARATDRDLEQLPNQVPAHTVEVNTNRPAETGREISETKHPGGSAGEGQSANSGGGPPGSVPSNGGAKAKPITPGGGKPPSPPAGKKP